MNELVTLVSKKTGLSPVMAQVAVNLVLDYLKKKLPKAVGAQIDLFLANEAQVTAAASAIGGLIGAAKKAAAKKAPAKKTAGKKR